jgi:hypothetical protein
MGGIKVLAVGNVYTLFAAGSFRVCAFRINPLQNLSAAVGNADTLRSAKLPRRDTADEEML